MPYYGISNYSCPRLQYVVSALAKASTCGSGSGGEPLGRRSVAKATAIITFASIISKLLGFARETVVAKYFGATSQTDAYLVAFIIPGVILSLLGGALPGTMIPVFRASRLAS